MSNNMYDAIDASSQLNELTEEVRLLRATIEKMKYDMAQLSEANADLERQLRRARRVGDEAWEQLTALRGSAWWRAGLPVRRVVSSIRK